jgi:hypothetical protein
MRAGGRIGILAAVIAGAVSVGWGCSHRAARRPPVAPTTSPVAAAATASSATVFARPKLGIQLSYPDGWDARPSAEYELLVRPAPAGDAAGDTWMSLDVPDLPFHIPGMIPIGAVRSGYLDDLRKQAPSLTTEDLPPPDVGASSSRMVRSRWNTDGGNGAEETALLMVHGDRVYIVRARSDAGHAAETRAAFDAVVRSIRWIKPSTP